MVSLPLLPRWQFKVWQQQPSAPNAPYNLKPAHQSLGLLTRNSHSWHLHNKRKRGSLIHPLPPTSPFPACVTPPLLLLCSDPNPSSTPLWPTSPFCTTNLLAPTGLSAPCSHYTRKHTHKAFRHNCRPRSSAGYGWSMTRDSHMTINHQHHLSSDLFNFYSFIFIQDGIRKSRQYIDLSTLLSRFSAQSGWCCGQVTSTRALSLGT